MPTDYTEERTGAYEDIAEAGTAIDIIVPSDAVTDENRPWLGNSEEPDPIKHFALFTSPGGEPRLTAFNEIAIIPAHPLPFEITGEMRIAPLKADGSRLGPEYQLTSVVPLRPDASQPILYKCGFERWPGNG